MFDLNVSELAMIGGGQGEEFRNGSVDPVCLSRCYERCDRHETYTDLHGVQCKTNCRGACYSTKR